MSEGIRDHDEWAYGLPKLERAPVIELPELGHILPFDGVRNPSGRSASSHKSFFTYRTEANGWVPRLGMTESAAELAVALEALLDPNLYDLKFQPLTVTYLDENGVSRRYTHDLLLVFRDGHRRLVFVRNEASLLKPLTERAIEAIAAATPNHAADDLIIVNASDYTRQRRENLFRLHHISWEKDADADQVVMDILEFRQGDVFIAELIQSAATISPDRAFRACLRAIARGDLLANLDNVISELSKVRRA